MFYRFIKYFFRFKGIFHPKKQTKKHLSSFTHPQISSFEHKRRFWRIVDGKSWWTPLTSIVFFSHSIEVNGDQHNCLLLEPPTGLEQREGASKW